MPTFQNPTGVTMPLERRQALVELARERGILILEDDPYGELWVDSPPPPAIRSLDDHVAYLGTFSKVMLPSPRIGYLVASRRFIEAFGQGRDQVEQTAVQIEVLVLEGRQVGQTGGVVVEQQAAIDVLHLFVIAQAVLAETVQHVEDEGDGQQGGGEAAKSGWNHGEGVEEVSVRSTHDPARR